MMITLTMIISLITNSDSDNDHISENDHNDNSDNDHITHNDHDDHICDNDHDDNNDHTTQWSI